MSKKVVLKKGREEVIKRKHPWIFSGAIDKMDKGVRDGDRVDVRDDQGGFLAVGHFQGESSIAIRIISFEPIADIAAFWKDKIQNAYQYRATIGLIDHPETNCYRLLHADGDSLPGLIIDIYNSAAVIQCHSIGMHRDLSHIVQAIQSVYGNQVEAIYSKSAATLPKEYGTTVEDKYLLGDTSACPTIIKENDMLFEINWETGQKTGFFIDQRNNREHIAPYVKGKKVLNAFSYSGAFSVYALKAGASEVHSVDVSKTAIALGDRNVEINNIDSKSIHKSITEDVMYYLKHTEETYDVIIVDPPAFAKTQKKRHNAIQAYKRLNVQALNKVKSGGIIFTFSCSQVVDKQLFYDTIKAAAIEANKSIRVLRYLSQPPDHPVSLFHDQSSYLKGLALYIE